MRGRDRTEIIAQILEVAKDGGTMKTKIMYAVGLSFNQLKEYLALLEDNALLLYNDGLKIYKTTDKGFVFLQSYSQINNMLTPTKLEEKPQASL
jgi:predicted transcriptional regulator